MAGHISRNQQLLKQTGLALTATLLLTAPLTTGHADDMQMAAAPACHLPASHNDDGSMSNTPSHDSLAAAYDCFEPYLLGGYAHSKHIFAQVLSEWERVDSAPFMYDDVGDHYLVVYGNERSTGEEKTLWLDRNLPVGATLGVAGFTVNDDGTLSAAPLMIYEKLVQGQTFGRGNWRQTLIAPDGEILGVTNGPGADTLTACADCAARSSDRLYLALHNDGVVPADAPEPSAPITENQDGTFGGESLDPNATLSPAPLDPLAPSSDIPAAQSFDPNANMAPSDPLDPLAPLDPSAPLDPNAPLDPLAPLAPLDSTSAAPQQSFDLEPLTDTADNASALDDTAFETDQPETTASDLAESIDNLNDGTRETLAETADTVTEALSTFARELSDALDPLLAVPSIAIADPPPYVEGAQEGS